MNSWVKNFYVTLLSKKYKYTVEDLLINRHNGSMIEVPHRINITLQEFINERSMLKNI